MSIQNYVKLEPVAHRYFDLDNREYDSVSKVLNSVEKQQDWWEIAGNVCGKGKFSHLKTQKEVFDYWRANGKEATDHGSNLHAMQERYAKEFKILEKDKLWEQGIKYIASMFKDYYNSSDEATVYSSKYMCAGTMDKALLVKKGQKFISIVDYKTALKKSELDYYHKDGDGLLHPVSHLQHCKYSRYALQLSIYGVMAEECAGLSVRDLFIIFIPTDPKIMPYKIPVPYMRTDAVNILDHFYNKNNTVISSVEEQEEEAPNFYIE